MINTIDMIGKIIQNYRIVSKIGEGGMGTVYLAEHITIHRKVAIKFLNPIFLQNPFIKKEFINEAQILANLYHPNIVLFIDFGSYGNNLYFIMEFIEGISLDKLILNKNYHFSENLIKKIFTDILMGLDYAHNNNIIHRDLKPSNIIISKNSTGKLLDFGIAKILSADVIDRSTSIRIGTPYYMSPEQIKKNNIIDIRTDIYSLGITLFEAVTKYLPYGEITNNFSITKKIIEEDIPSPKLFNPKISDMLESVILKATEKKPENRFQNCKEFLDALNNPDFRYIRKKEFEICKNKYFQEIKAEKTKFLEESVEEIFKRSERKEENIQDKILDEKNLVINKIENPYKNSEYKKIIEPEKVKNVSKKEEFSLYIISVVISIIIIVFGIIIFGVIQLPNSGDKKESNNKFKERKTMDTVDSKIDPIENNPFIKKGENKIDSSRIITKHKKTKRIRIPPKSNYNINQKDNDVSSRKLDVKKDTKKDENKKTRVRIQ